MYASALSPVPTGTSTVDFAGSGTHVRAYGAYKPVFCEGDDAGFLYEVIEGVVCNSRVLPDGRRHVISFSYPGDLIGLGHDEYYRFSCDTVSVARIRSIPINAILCAVKERPGLGEKLLEAATTQLAEMHDHSVMLGCNSAIEKVASFVLALAKRESGVEAIHLPMKRTDLANYLGLTVETVSRNLTKLRVRGIIDMPKPYIIIMHDMDRLEALADGEIFDF